MGNANGQKFHFPRESVILAAMVPAKECSRSNDPYRFPGSLVTEEFRTKSLFRELGSSKTYPKTQGSYSTGQIRVFHRQFCYRL